MPAPWTPDVLMPQLILHQHMLLVTLYLDVLTEMPPIEITRATPPSGEYLSLAVL